MTFASIWARYRYYSTVFTSVNTWMIVALTFPIRYCRQGALRSILVLLTFRCTLTITERRRPLSWRGSRGSEPQRIVERRHANSIHRERLTSTADVRPATSHLKTRLIWVCIGAGSKGRGSMKILTRWSIGQRMPDGGVLRRPNNWRPPTLGLIMVVVNQEEFGGTQ